MNKRFAVLPVLALVGSLSIPTIAQAAPFKDAAGVVYFQDAGQTAAQKLTIQLTGSPVTKNVTANQCGLATVPVPSATVPMPASIKIGATIVDVSSLSVAATPKCALNSTTGTYALATPAPTNFKTIDGKVVVIGQPASLSQIVEYTGVGKVKTATADKCGMAKLGSTSAPAPSTFQFGGTNYTTASLPVAIPNRCIGGIKYAPVGGSGSGSVVAGS